MRVLPTALRLTLVLAAVPASADAAVWYVRANAANDQSGTSPAAASADLCATLTRAREGDDINLAAGSFDVACVLATRGLRLRGGFTADFLTQDAFATPTVLRPASSKQPALRISDRADDIVLSGLVFDGGATADYSTQRCEGCWSSSYNSAVHAPLVALEAAGVVTFRDVAWINAPGGAVSGSGRGALFFDNVSVANARPFAFMLSGACGYAAPRCLDVSIRHASLVWIWGKLPLLPSPDGSAVVVSRGVLAKVQRSVLAYANRVGIELDGQAPQELAVADLVSFGHGFGDIGFSQGDGGTAVVPLAEAERLTIAGAHAGRTAPLALTWDPAYHARYLARASPPFYGGRLDAQFAAVLSPDKEAGMQPIGGARNLNEPATAASAAAAPDDAPSAAAPDKRKRPPKGQKKSKKRNVK